MCLLVVLIYYKFNIASQNIFIQIQKSVFF